MSKKDYDDDLHIHIHSDSDSSESSPLKELGIFLAGIAMLIAGLFFFHRRYSYIPASFPRALPFTAFI